MPEMDPKQKLTQLLSEQGENDEKDLNTEFTTPSAVKYQIFLRTLGEGLGIDYFNKKADTIANAMWSYERKSRGEAVMCMSQRSENQQVALVGAVGADSTPLMPVAQPKKKGLFRRG